MTLFIALFSAVDSGGVLPRPASKILRLWIFQERDFIVRATDFPTVTAAVTSASHDSVVNALPLEVPHPPDSKQRKNEFTLDMSR